jgi:hypothetical protein
VSRKLYLLYCSFQNRISGQQKFFPSGKVAPDAWGNSWMRGKEEKGLSTEDGLLRLGKNKETGKNKDKECLGNFLFFTSIWALFLV